MIFGKAVFVDAVVVEACFLKYIGNFVEMIGDVLGLVGIGAYGHDLSAEFAVTLESGNAGVELLHSLAHGLGVDLDSFFIIDQVSEDLIDYVSVISVIVFPCSAGQISDDVVEVTQNIEIMEFFDVLEIFGEILL